MRISWQAWAMLGALGWVLAYADRAVFGPLLRPIGSTFHVGPAALGLLSTAFFFAYTILQLPAGYVSDRLGPRFLLAASFFGFGLSILLSGLSPWYWLLVAFTFLAGLFQSVYYPAQYAITGRSVPLAARPRANALINGGMGVGIAVGFAIASTPLFLADWRLLLLLAGAATVLTGALFYAFAPRSLPVDRLEATRGVPWSRDLLLLCLANFGSLFGFFFFLSWFPYYLETSTRLSGFALSAASAIAPLLSAPAGMLWTQLFGHRRLLAMRLFFPLSALALLLTPVLREGLWIFLPLTVYGLVGKLPTDPILLTETVSRLPARDLGSGLGVLNFAGMLASVLAPLVSGILAERPGGLDVAFTLSAVLLLGSFAAVTVLGNAGQATAL